MPDASFQYAPEAEAMTLEQHRTGSADGDPLPSTRYENLLSRRRDEVVREDEDWRSKGACYALELSVMFEPSSFERKEERLKREAIAKRFCATCPVLQQCLDYAISNRERGGIWGGMNYNERKRLIGREKAS